MAVRRGPKLVLVSAKQRKLMRVTSRTNAARKRAYASEVRSRTAPGACESCGASSCGQLWPATRCCISCTHMPVEGWSQTHSAYERGHKFAVMEVAMRAGDRIFLRADGVVQFVQLACGSDDRPRVLFEGDDLSHGALFVAGREDYDEENQWFNRTEAGLQRRLEGEESELEAEPCPLGAQERSAQLEKLLDEECGEPDDDEGEDGDDDDDDEDDDGDEDDDDDDGEAL